jgi:hypothetical protein
MANLIHQPAYRAYVFTASGMARNADGSINLDGSTFLTPRDATIHSDAFKVASIQGVSGFQPYLEIPKGRKGHIDPLKRTTDTGQITLVLLDKRTGTDNLTRWVTAFLGDAEGRDQVLGLPVYIEESLDGGSVWTPWFTGKVYVNGLRDRLHTSLTLRDNADDMGAPIFVTRPESSITYAEMASLLPTGLLEDYAQFQKVAKIPATVRTKTVTGAGSFRYLDIDHKSIGNTNADDQALVITQGLVGVATKQELLGQNLLDLTERVRVKATVTSGGGAGSTGEFLMVPAWLISGQGGTPLGPFTAKKNGQGHYEARNVWIDEVDVSDPNYLAIPADTTTVDIYLIPRTDPSEEAPLLIDDVHPVQLWADILDGKFGRLDVSGDPVDTFPRDVTTFATFIADTSIGVFRAPIQESDVTNTWIEENICQPYNLAYYLDGEGRVVPVDMRDPTSYGSLTTLDNDDINTKASAPKWEDTLDGVMRELHLVHYLDQALDPQKAIKEDSALFPKTPAIGIGQTSRAIVPIPFGRLDLPYRKPFVLNCLGYRYMGGDATPETYQGRARSEYIQNRLLEMAQGMESAYASGIKTAVLNCRRTTAADIQPGTIRLVDVDELPDPSTNLRGGPRVMRCVGRSEMGIMLTLRMMDLGENAVATAPTLGTLILTSGKELRSITLPVTLNVDSERVRMDVAVTTTAVGTRPAETSPLWHQVQMTEATGNLIVDRLPSGSRIWPRVRTEPAPGDAPKLPSGWVYPTVPASVDTTGLAAPTSGGSNVLDGSETELTWTVGNPDFEVVVALDGDLVARLPAGSAFFLLRGTDASTSYAATVWHVDEFGGESTKLTINFSSGATPATAPFPGGIGMVIGDRV